MRIPPRHPVGLTLTAISLTTGATINGRALARNGSVTLDTNTNTNTNTNTRPACQTGGTTGEELAHSAPTCSCSYR